MITAVRRMWLPKCGCRLEVDASRVLNLIKVPPAATKNGISWHI